MSVLEVCNRNVNFVIIFCSCSLLLVCNRNQANVFILLLSKVEKPKVGFVYESLRSINTRAKCPLWFDFNSRGRFYIQCTFWSSSFTFLCFHGRFNALLRVTISSAISHPVRVLQHLWRSFPHCYCYGHNPISSGPAQRCQPSEKIACKASRRKSRRGRLWLLHTTFRFNRKLLELKYIRSTRAHRYHRLSL